MGQVTKEEGVAGRAVARPAVVRPDQPAAYAESFMTKVASGEVSPGDIAVKVMPSWEADLRASLMSSGDVVLVDARGTGHRVDGAAAHEERQRVLVELQQRELQRQITVRVDEVDRADRLPHVDRLQLVLLAEGDAVTGGEAEVLPAGPVGGGVGGEGRRDLGVGGGDVEAAYAGDADLGRVGTCHGGVTPCSEG